MAASVDQIKQALAKLVGEDDNHWTADGLPRIDAVRELAGDGSITRDQITQSAPGFSRAAVLASVQAATPAASPAPAAATVPAPPAAVMQQETAPGVPPPAAPPVAPVATIDTTGLVDQKLLVVNPAAVPVPQETVDAMQEELAAIESDLTLIAKAEADLRKDKEVRQTRADDLRLRIEKARPRDTNTDAIQNYLSQQRKTLDARAAQIGRARAFETETGVRISDLLPKKSPIDQAMARKTGFGSKRPV
jgi:hypothetical protein